MHKKVLNVQVAMELVSYLSFALMTIYFIVSKKYLQYITPKMMPYLYLMIVILIIWMVHASGRLFQYGGRPRGAHCFVLIVPLLLFVLPHPAIKSSDVSSRFVATSSSTQNAFGTSTSFSNKLTGLDADKKTITISDEQFSLWVNAINSNPDKYQGYEVTMKGFVFKDAQSMSSVEFVVARMLMSCCVVDLSPFGIYCEDTQAAKRSKDQWVTVQGVIGIGDHNGKKVAKIQVTKVTDAKKPKDEYVYPDFE